MKKLLPVLLLILCAEACAQNMDKLYSEGKALYDTGKYVQAVPKLREAALKGHKKAQYRLGRCYDKGKGVKEDDAKAFYWYAKAAAQNHVKAQYQLGKSYKNGEGTAQNLSKAVWFISKAARQGYAPAQLALGKCYLKGRGVAADRAKACAWILKAVRNEKGGKKILDGLRKGAASGDEGDKAILALIGK